MGIVGIRSSSTEWLLGFWFYAEALHTSSVMQCGWVYLRGFEIGMHLPEGRWSSQCCSLEYWALILEIGKALQRTCLICFAGGKKVERCACSWSAISQRVRSAFCGMNGSYSLLDATGDYPELAHTIVNTSVNRACEQTINQWQTRILSQAVQLMSIIPPPKLPLIKRDARIVCIQQ